MKNYYDILGLSSYEDSQDVILGKYREVTTQLRAHVLDKDMSQQLIDVNEAFLVLSDRELKKKYDYTLSSNSENEELLSLLTAKKQKAEQFVKDKLSNAPKKRKKSKWPAIICGFFLLSALGTISRTCSQAYMQEKSSHAEVVNTFAVPSDWTEYKIDNAFSLSVPNTMELRNDYDDYTQWATNNIGLLSSADAVFQQKDLSSMTEDAYNTYARVLIQHFSFSPGEVEHHYESPGLVSEDYRNLREMVDEEIKPYTYIERPTWRWIDIDGTKAIEGSYRRNGDDGPVKCKLYLLSNYNEMAKILVTFREKDSERWASDLDNVIRTFKWESPR
ncbi:hypothetical protein EEL50_09140 [Muribaculaceae bacterium Isolate-105 (HZI)]|nr:hypothetical protein EEL50_09140 [Muribaculaceae bacterium Isolate-105 (HZI)]